MLGMPIAGLLWSLATYYAKSDLVASLNVPPLQAFFAIALGGLATIFAMWVGFAAVAWAVIRAFGGSVPILIMTTLISRAAPPLWIAAPAAAYWVNAGTENTAMLALVTLAGLALFLVTLAQLIAAQLGWSQTRATISVFTVAVFLGSFAYLSM